MSKPLLAELRGALALFEAVRAKQVAADKVFDAVVDRAFREFTVAEWRSFYRRNEALWKRAHERGIKRNEYPVKLVAHAIKILERRK